LDISNSSFHKVNLIFQTISLVNSELFENLYIKILYQNNENEKNDFSNSAKEEELYDVFSLWMLFRNMKSILSSNNNDVDIDINSSFFERIENGKIQKHLSDKNIFIDNFISKNLIKYFDHLFHTNRIKKGETSEYLNENEIFSKGFYSIFDILLKSHKLEYMKYNENILKQIFNEIPQDLTKCSVMNISNNFKEKLKYIKNVYCLINNNGNHSFQITLPLNK
jgi:hypothetical protein